MNTFRVTFETVTPESAEQGEFESSGFVSEVCTLREAIDLIGGAAYEADSWPVSRHSPPRWLTNTEYGEDYSTGERESRSMHFPRNISPSSALRVARLLGIKTRP